MRAKVIENRLSDGSKVYSVAFILDTQVQEVYLEVDCELTARNIAHDVEYGRILDVWTD